LEKMKVLVFNETPAPTGGGMNYYVMDLLSRLREAGVTLALVHGRQTPSQHRGTGYIIDGLGHEQPMRAADRQRLHAVIEDFSPDIIQVHGVKNLRLLAELKRYPQVVCFVHTHDVYCSGGSMTWRLPRRTCDKPHGRACLVRHLASGCGSYNPAVNWISYRRVNRSLRLLGQFRRVVTTSRTIHENLLANGLAPSHVTWLPPYAPEVRGDSGPVTKTATRSLLHVGGLTGKKGVWLAVRTLRLLPENTEILFAGAGSEQEALQEHVRRRGLGSRIRVFPNPTPEQWDKLYRQSEFILFPSLWNEPLGWLALRAFSYGKPVVAFANHGVGSWVEDGVNGVLVGLDERNRFQQEVSALINDTPRLQKLGARALQDSREKFASGPHVAALTGLYRELLAS